MFWHQEAGKLRGDLMNGIACIPVNKRWVPTAWEFVAPLLQKALDMSRGEICLKDIYDDLNKGIGKLCVIVADEKVIAAFIIEMREFRRKKVCYVPYIGGERLDEWCDIMLNLAEKIAIAEKADAVYGMGRRGWGRKLRDSGYKEYYTTVGKEL